MSRKQFLENFMKLLILQIANYKVNNGKLSQFITK